MDGHIFLLSEAALRSVVLAGACWVLLWALRVRNVPSRLAAWTAVLVCALLMPALVAVAPSFEIPLPLPASPWQVQVGQVSAPSAGFPVGPRRAGESGPPSPAVVTAASRPWSVAGFAYAVVTAALLLHMLAGAIRLRRVRMSGVRLEEANLEGLRDTVSLIGVAVVESAAIRTPATYGWRRPVVLLPTDWRGWSRAKLAAVLAHEASHIARADFLVQFLARVHRAIFWFSPLGWWLARHLADLSEQASDGEGAAASGDNTYYAEVVFGFLAARRNYRAFLDEGVTMARTSAAGRRIERILEGGAVARGTAKGRWGAALTVGLLACLAAAASPTVPAVPVAPVAPAAAVQPAAPVAPSAQAAPVAPVPPKAAGQEGSDAYVFVQGDSHSMSGSSRDLERAMSYRSRYPGNYVWMRRGGREYVVDDPAFLEKAAALFAPMKELGRQQSALGDKMSAIGEQMSTLGKQMAGIRADMPDLSKAMRELEEQMKSLAARKASMNELGDMQSKLGALQARLGEAQARTGEAQRRLGEKMGELGREQGKLGKEQGRLGEEQGRLAREANRKLGLMLDEAVRNGAAKPQ